MTTESDIVHCLTDDLRRAPYKGHPNPLRGHCYVASEALYHLKGGKAAGLKPMFISHEGAPHWFLADTKNPGGAGTSSLLIRLCRDQRTVRDACSLPSGEGEGVLDYPAISSGG